MATSPAPPQVVVVEPHTIDLTGRPLRTEITYAISSLEPEQASAARPGRLLRSHWEIENRLHWVRDVTSGEYHSQIRVGATPSVMACLRNLIIGAVSRAGAVNVVAALRRHARDPRRLLATSGSPSDEPASRKNAGAPLPAQGSGVLFDMPDRAVMPDRSRPTHLPVPSRDRAG